MKSFKEWLNEASRWKSSSWKRPPVDVMERMKKYNRVGYYVHFSEMEDKIGINPKTIETHGTPYGIYAYTVKYALAKGVQNLPYASDYAYVWIFRAKHPKKIKKISSVEERSYTKGSPNYLNNYGKLWRSYSTIDGLGMTEKFLKKGIEGFIDEGTGTIHPSEPYQAVFFGSQTIIPVDVFPNIRKKPGKMPKSPVFGLIKNTQNPKSDFDSLYGVSKISLQTPDDDYDDGDFDYLDDSDVDFDDEPQTAYGISPWEKK